MDSQIPQLALIGCGIFARDAYLPILKSLQTHLSLTLIWSRSEDSAKQLLLKVHDFAPAAEAEWGEEGLERILGSPHVHCCAVVLPILTQPRVVLRALHAGKHVLQALAEGIETLRTFASEMKAKKSEFPIWAIAENFRFEPAFFEAGKLIKDLGTMIVVQVNIEVPMNSSNKYFLSEWRRDPALKGAFITDCGVHFVAGLRTMLGGCDIISISAVATHRNDNVPPPDTLTTLLTLDNGCTGVMIITYSSSNNKASWRVVCSGGSVEVDRGFLDGMLGYTVNLVPLEGTSKSKFFPVQGLQEELKSFANDVFKRRMEGGNTPDLRSSPAEALKDLAIIQTALSSGLHHAAPHALKPPFISDSLWT